MVKKAAFEGFDTDIGVVINRGSENSSRMSQVVNRIIGTASEKADPDWGSRNDQHGLDDNKLDIF